MSMSESISFVLAPIQTTSTTSSKPLNLLPFSLGSSSQPYTSTSAPISSYFQPRPCPPNTPGIKEGSTIATFRGRQLVGQDLEVPRGYKGAILETGQKPLGGSVSGSYANGQAKEGKWPLTPASSMASSSAAESANASTSTVADPSDSSGGVRRSPRKVRGSGQVALSKPRQTIRRGLRKRLRLDSDSEDDTPAVVSSITAADPSTPKRAKTPVRAPVELPEIKIQAPTPRKKEAWEDPSPVKRPLLRRGGSPVPMSAPAPAPAPSVEVDDDVYGGIQVPEEEDVNLGARGDGDEVKEEIVPSPAAEDEPPSFDLTRRDPSGAGSGGEIEHVERIEEEDRRAEKAEKGKSESVTYEDGQLQRVLRPISTFERITLWTADTPLQGFRQDELATAASASPRDGVQSGAVAIPQVITTSPSAERGKDDATEPEEKDKGEGGGATSGLDLNKGWWRVGGAGEGGDEFVRGMGEWIGLVQMINDPIYLSGLPDEDDSDDDDLEH